MASPFHLFRRNQKAMLAVLGVMAMISFVFLDPRFMGGGGSGQPKNPVVVQTQYGELRESDLDSMMRLRRLVETFLYALVAETYADINIPQDQSRELKQFVDERFQQVRMRVMQRPHDHKPEQAAVETMIMSKRAEALGMVVSDDAINKFVQQITFDRVTSERVKEIIGELKSGQHPVGAKRLFDGLRTELLASNLTQTFGVALEPMSPGQRWEYFLRLNRRATIEFVPVSVLDFMSDVEDPGEAEIQAFFDKYKNQLPQPGSPDPGFKEPRKAALQYFVADVDKFAAKTKVTEEQIKKYYDDNKPTYRVRHFSNDQPGDKPVDSKPGPTAEKPDDSKSSAPESEPGSKEPKSNEPTSEQPGTPPSDPPAGKEPVPKGAPATGDPKATPADPAPKNESAPGDPKKEAVTEPPKSSATRLLGQAKLVSQLKPVPAAKDSPAPKSAAPAATEPPPATDPAAAKDAPTEAPAEPAAPKSGADAKSPADPVDEKASDRKKEDPKKEGSKQPDSKKPDPKKEEEEFEPLEKVHDEIKATLEKMQANAAIADVFATLERAMTDYANERVLHGEDNSEVKPLDFAELAKTHEVSAKETELISAGEAQDETDLGKSDAFQQGRPFTERFQTYAPVTTQDAHGHQFLFWKTRDVDEAVPTLDEVRKQVKRVWKAVQARDLALQQANKLRAEVQKAKQPLSKLFNGRKDFEVKSAGPFPWMTAGPVLQPNALASESTVDGVKSPGPEFMRAVFSLDPNQAGVAMNQARDTAYVVQPLHFDPSQEVLEELFSRQPVTRYLPVARREQQQTFLAWLTNLETQSGVKWLREPLELRER